ncbi:hypothetical protein HYT56_02510 [Candidatus Woesearchaeota archaeon]|nr:hypothetical protein [Candidatus Woesearchaeota archaeon]
MNLKRSPNYAKGLIIGICVNVVGTYLFPILTFLGLFGSWLNFSQYSTMGFATNIIENYILSWIIVLTISILIGLYFDLKKKRKRIFINFAIILAIILIAEIFVFGYSWRNSGIYQTWDKLEDCPKLKDVDKKDSCYWTFALENNDSDLCYELSGDYRNSMQRSIQYCLARVNKNPSYCKNVERINGCFSSLAIDLLDKSICNNINDSEERSKCVQYYLYFININQIEDN